jgi:hypothetical protein
MYGYSGGRKINEISLACVITGLHEHLYYSSLFKAAVMSDSSFRSSL